jgi:hypothetical protein
MFGQQALLTQTMTRLPGGGQAVPTSTVSTAQDAVVDTMQFRPPTVPAVAAPSDQSYLVLLGGIAVLGLAGAYIVTR